MKLKEKSETKSWRTLCATKDLRLCFDDNGEGLNGFEQETAMIRFFIKSSRQLCGGTTRDGPITQ